MIEADEKRQTGLTEKQVPLHNRFIPARAINLPTATANERASLKSKGIESKLTMEIPPWEREEFDVLQKQRNYPKPASLLPAANSKKRDAFLTETDRFCSLFIKIVCGISKACVK